MNGNGRKPSSKQSGNERPWWHSGSHCLAALLWCFTLAVVWHGTFGWDGMTWPAIGTFSFSLVFAVLASCVAMAGSKR